MLGQMNAVRRQNRPGGLRRRGVTGHSPALARLFLVGLRPRRAQRRFTGQKQYRTREEHAERTTVASALPAGKRPSPAVASLRCHLDSALVPSVRLIETALAVRDGRKKYSVLGRTECGTIIRPFRPDRLPSLAHGFTKGCVGVQPHTKRTARQPRKSDRDNPTLRQPGSSNAMPKHATASDPEAPTGFSAETAQTNPPRGP